MDTDLNVRAKPIKLLDENTAVNIYDFGLGKVFLQLTLKYKWQRKKRDKLDFIKIKKFHAASDTIKRVKRQHTDCEKIFAHHMSNKGLVSRIYELLQLNHKKITQFKMDKRAFPGGAVVKNLPANAGDMGSIPGLGRSHMPQSN